MGAFSNEPQYPKGYGWYESPRREGPRREVTISQPFYMGVTEVTQAQYECITGKNPSGRKGARNPVECLLWSEVKAFCDVMSKKTGLLVRVPTEAQWEYACRAGTNTRWSFGDKNKDLPAHAWYKDNSDGMHHPVGLKKPNPAGLYDMHGNVREWCRDYYDHKFYAKAQSIDPENTTEAMEHVVRGRMWYGDHNQLRSAYRDQHPSLNRSNSIGLRVLVALGGKLITPPPDVTTATPATPGKAKVYTRWPCDAAQSAARRIETAKALGISVERDIDLGKGVKMKLALIPAGKFVMGSFTTVNGYSEGEGPPHEATISKPFYMGVTEVTQEQYESVTGKNPSGFKSPKNPVEQVSWDDAKAFCEALSKKTALVVRLPSEAQWEYACRAGTNTRFSFGDEDKNLGAYGWYNINSDGKSHPVGLKKPNPAGLYDMHGNVWEWVRDWYTDEFYASAKNVDPENTTVSKARVFRGGSRSRTPNDCRAARRHPCGFDFCRNELGFRVVVQVP